MGGLVTRVKIGAFEMMLDPKYLDQRRAAERLAEWDDNHDDIFSPADTWGSVDAAINTLAQAWHREDADFRNRLSAIVHVINDAEPLRPFVDEITARFENGGRTSCSASAKTWNALGGSSGLRAFRSGYCTLLMDYQHLVERFPEAFHNVCTESGSGYAGIRSCAWMLRGGSVYGALDRLLQAAERTAREISAVDTICSTLDCDGADCRSEGIKLISVSSDECGW